MTADTSRSAVHDRSQPGPVGDLGALHAREADRLLAYLCSTDRALGLADAEAVCQQAFLEVRGSWPSHAPYSRPEVAVFAAARRVVSGRPRSAPGAGDALTESAPDYWDRADVARLTVLQDSLDRLSPVPRQAVVLREMCGFTPPEVAEIIGLPEPAVESARGDALRTLVPMIEAGTTSGTARRGPLSPEDFAALGRVLQHTDPRRIEDRQRFALSLAQPPAMTQAPAFGAGAPQGAPTAPPTAAVMPGLPVAPTAQPTAPPTSVLGGMSPSGDALFAATGPAPAPDPSASGGWMGGFGVRRPPTAGAPGAMPPAVSGPPTTMSGAPMTRDASSMTGSLPLGSPGFGGSPAAPTAPPSYPAPTPAPTFAAPPPGPTYAPTPPAPTYAAPPPAPTYQSAPTYTGDPTYSGSLNGPTSLMPTSLRPGTTPLDAPGVIGEAGLNVGTPIFDSVSAWFSAPPQPASGEPGRNGHSHPAASHWASLQDAGWREASARAAAGPQIAGNTGSGLPMRAPGANMVPSAAEAALGMTRPFSREAPRADPGRVRNRLDSFQQGVQTARQMRDHLVDEPAAPPVGVEPIVARQQSQTPAAAPNGAAASGPPSGSVPVEGSGGDGEVRRGREGGFGVFYRDYLPHLLALLMVEGARPADAAQIAQDAMSEAYREWAQLENPREWTRQVAMSTWSVQRRAVGSGSSGQASSASGPSAGGGGEPAGGAPSRSSSGLPTRSKGTARP